MTTPGPPDRVLRLRDGSAEWRMVEGEVVVLDTERSEFLAVNRSGASLWSLLAEGASRDQLVDVLIDRYGLDAARAAADLDRFVADLTTRRLLEP
jgi:hypothetical protein